MRIVRDNKDTEYGKRYHFDQISSVDDYKRLVPFSGYDDYAPYIERMVNNGEKNLITVYPIVQYAETSGSIGVPKKIPVSKQSMEIYTKYTITRVTALADAWQREHNHHKLPVGAAASTSWRLLTGRCRMVRLLVTSPVPPRNPIRNCSRIT